jgi:hypothetical protein
MENTGLGVSGGVAIQRQKRAELGTKTSAGSCCPLARRAIMSDAVAAPAAPQNRAPKSVDKLVNNPSTHRAAAQLKPTRAALLKK